MTFSKTSFGILLLAAGLGKRMRSPLPKILHEIGGEPLIIHILNRIKEACPKAPLAIVVGPSKEKIEETIRKNPHLSSLKITFIHQEEQRGTGDAASVAMRSAWGQALLQTKTPLLVLPGDQPLMPTELISQMTEPLSRACALRLLTCELPDPTGYGRVIRRGKRGSILRIVEERDANSREKAVKEVAASTYLFQSHFLDASLQRLSNKNAQSEYYLTDLVHFAIRSKKHIDLLQWQSPDDLRGINNPWELALAQRLINERTIKKWAQKGVRFVDPWNTCVDVTVELAEDVVIYPGAMLSGNTQIGRGTSVGPHVILKDMKIGEKVTLKTGCVAEQSVICDQAQVGPYAHLRPDSLIGTSSKIGNFVELKKTKVGSHTSIAHLSYLGDAEVGDRVNIGCGFITCNFDGRIIDGQRKHRTIIEDDVFLGSDCQTVAPVRIKKGAYIASGSTITEDVESESLAIARSKQINKPGYALKLRDIKK